MFHTNLSISLRSENEILGWLSCTIALTGWLRITIWTDGCTDWWHIRLLLITLGQTDIQIPCPSWGIFQHPCVHIRTLSAMSWHPAACAQPLSISHSSRWGIGCLPAWQQAITYQADFTAVLSPYPTSFLLSAHSV